MVAAMELAELLEQEGLDPETLMPWARARADALVVELSEGGSEAGEPLRALLDGLAVADAELEVASRIASPASFTPLTEPSGLKPIAGAADLPPPPEPLVRADGEPDTLLETFDTSAFEIASPSAETVITEVPVAPEAETVITELRPVASIETAISPSPYFDDAGEASERESDDGDGDDDELEELELDELVELDEDELVELVEDDEDEQSEAGPPPPPPSDAADLGLAAAAEHPPVRSGDTATGLPVISEPIATEHDTDFTDEPVRSGDTATGLPIVADDPELAPVQTGGTASFPTLADVDPVRTGATAAHAVLDEPEEVDLDGGSPGPSALVGDDDESFELDFDD
jgi:hypothetical protein